MRSWPHSGFSVDQSVFLAAGDRAGIERLVQYMTRCPFTLSRLVEVTSSGEVVYKAEKDACRAFPDPDDDGLGRGVKRNFQILSPLDLLAEFTQHIPAKGSHLVRYYGWYSNKARGMRAKAAEAGRAAEASSDSEAGGVRTRSRSTQTWAMLIKRMYEVDPLACPSCSGQMKVIAFIEPPQQDVIEKILRHCERVGSVAATGVAGTRGIGPRRRAPGINVRGRKHLLGDVLILPAPRWAQGRRVPWRICGGSAAAWGTTRPFEGPNEPAGPPASAPCSRKSKAAMATFDFRHPLDSPVLRG